MVNINKPRVYSFSYYLKPITNKKPFDEPMSLADLEVEIKSDKHKAKTIEYRDLVSRWKKAEVTANDPGEVATIKKRVKEFKAKEFNYITPNGIFTQRAENHLLNLSGLCVVDIDYINPEKLQPIFERIKSDAVLIPSLIFRSPGGEGLKVLYPMDGGMVPMDGTKRNAKAIEAINSYFATHYSDLIIPEYDKAGKAQYVDFSGVDISRACFICYDPDVYFQQVDQAVITEEFCQQYPPLPTAKAKERDVKQLSKKVSPKTDIHDLHKRHLLEKDNHHTNIIEFAGAAKNIGIDAETAIKYLIEFAHISPESAHSDPEKLVKEVHDVYTRYSNDTGGAIYLTQLTFAFETLYFKWSREADNFVVTSLYREGVKQKLHEFGFGKRYVSDNDFVFIQQTGPIIREVSTSQMRDEFMKYINSITSDLVFTYQGNNFTIPCKAVHETFNRDSNNLFNNTWLEHLQNNDAPLLKDHKETMYFVFKNCVVLVGKDEIVIKELHEFTGYCVWESQVIDREFEYVEENETCHFARFVGNVSSNDHERTNALRTVIGYLLHYHFEHSGGQGCILYDESITDVKKPMGGTGKGLFAQGIKAMRSVAKIDGKHFRNDDRFKWSLVTPSTQVVWLDDVKPDFDFEVLHSNLTDGWQVERKNLNTFNIPPEDSPKTLIASNRILKAEGRTNMRRQYVFEFSDHYARNIRSGHDKPIVKEHGCVFFSDEWSADEWNSFYSYMMDSAMMYLIDGVKQCKQVNIEANRLRQKTSEDFVQWCNEKEFVPGADYETTPMFEDFKNAVYGIDDKSFVQRKFSEWLKSFAGFKGWEYTNRRAGGKGYFKFE